jgi:hypothetical protein
MVHIIVPRPGDLMPDGLPPLPIRELMIGAVDLMREAIDLPQPQYATICTTQRLGLQFPPVPASFRAITRWALRFGGVLRSDTHHDAEYGPHIHCQLAFDYYGVRVTAYAIVPASPAAA